MDQRIAYPPIVKDRRRRVFITKSGHARGRLFVGKFSDFTTSPAIGRREVIERVAHFCGVELSHGAEDLAGFERLKRGHAVTEEFDLRISSKLFEAAAGTGMSQPQ